MQNLVSTLHSHSSLSFYNEGNCKLVLTYMNLPHTNNSLQTKGFPTGIVTTLLNEIKYFFSWAKNIIPKIQAWIDDKSAKY